MSFRRTAIGLLCLAALVQAMVVGRAVVPSRDAIRFNRMAEKIEHEGLLTVVRQQREQPLFPIWIWLNHVVLERIWGDYPGIRAASVQCAAVIPLLAVIPPLLLLSRRVYGSVAGTIGCCFFVVLPEASRLGADGISDSLHLFFFTVAFWAAVEFLLRPRGRGAMAAVFGDAAEREQATQDLSGATAIPMTRCLWLLLAGLASGLALLVRAEILVLPAAMLLAGALMQAWPRHRLPWSHLLVGGMGFALGMAVIVLPYLAWADTHTLADAVDRLLGRGAVVTALPAGHRAGGEAGIKSTDAAAWRLPDGEPMSFGWKEPGSIRRYGWLPAARLFGYELSRAYWFWIGLLGLIGLAAVHRLRGNRGDWFVRIFLVLYPTVAFAFTLREGYVAARHLLPMVVVSVGACACGAIAVGRFVAGRLGGPLTPARQAWVTAVIAAAACLACCWQTFLPVGHAEIAYRDAARWLASHAESDDAVVDTSGWTSLYSGRTTYLLGHGAAALADPRLRYFVIQKRDIVSASRRGSTLRALVAGEPLAALHGPAWDDGLRDVLIYAWRPSAAGDIGR